MVFDEVVLECLVEYSLDQAISQFRDRISSCSRVGLLGEMVLELGGWVGLSHSPKLLTTSDQLSPWPSPMRDDLQ
jgi:hypothetical protein